MLKLNAWFPDVFSEPMVSKVSRGLMHQLWAFVQADSQGNDVTHALQQLLSLQRNRRAQAFILLLHGQLLLRRKREGAWVALDEGLRRADGLLGSEEYFQVLNRHELLRRLALHDKVVEPMPLQALLNEAAVIARLQTAQPPVHFIAHTHDTLLGGRK